MEAVCVSTFPSCYAFLLYKERKKICKLQTSAVTHSRPFKTQKWYYGKKLARRWIWQPFWMHYFHEICLSLTISLLRIRIKMSYSSCSRLCEAVIMDWRQYFCPLLSVMTAVSELNIRLNSCQGDKFLEWFLFQWNNHLFLLLFFLGKVVIDLHFSFYNAGNL